MNNIYKKLKKEKILLFITFLFILLTTFIYFAYRNLYSSNPIYANIYLHEIYSLDLGSKKNILNSRFNKYVTNEYIEDTFLNIGKKNPEFSKICTNISIKKSDYVYQLKLIGISNKNEKKNSITPSQMQAECIKDFITSLSDLKKKLFSFELKEAEDLIIYLKNNSKSAQMNEKDSNIDRLNYILNNYGARDRDLLSAFYLGSKKSIEEPFSYAIVYKKYNSDILVYFFIIFFYISIAFIFVFLRNYFRHDSSIK